MFCFLAHGWTDRHKIEEWQFSSYKEQLKITAGKLSCSLTEEKFAKFYINKIIKNGLADSL